MTCAAAPQGSETFTLHVLGKPVDDGERMAASVTQARLDVVHDPQVLLNVDVAGDDREYAATDELGAGVPRLLIHARQVAARPTVIEAADEILDRDAEAGVATESTQSPVNHSRP